MKLKNDKNKIINSPTTPEELTTLMKSITKDEVEYNPEKYRYVIYVRKSTDEPTKQVRSLEDQVKECKEFAERNNFKCVAIVSESESAKESGIRPKFMKLLDDMGKGLYDGIIAWHPDRLARNMKDGGEMIDLLDKKIIKDLKFASFTFANDTSGKMLLGISFVIAKEYSDKLSDNVMRGNRRKLEIGKYVGVFKHGYYKDRNGLLRPDLKNDNFIKIKQAFQLRMDSKTLDDIADYLRKVDYYRTRLKGNKKYNNYKKSAVDRILKDPICVGVLRHGNEIINLNEIYDFVPLISVEDFMKINSLKSKEQLFKLAKRYKGAEFTKANLMKELVFCSECGHRSMPAITNKKTKKGTTKYFYYRCDNGLCDLCNKSTRAKVILDYVYEFLATKPFSCKQSYEHYKAEIKRIMAIRMDDALQDKRVGIAQKNKLVEKAQDIRDTIYTEDDAESKKYYKGDLTKAEKQIKEVESKIEKANEYISKGKETILTYEKFLELMDNMPKTLPKIKNMRELSYFMEKLYLNFYVNPKGVVKSTLNEPFKSLYELKISKCPPSRT